MSVFNNIPLSIYIHIPWCIKKCPYCDFNSYAQNEPLPEKAYIEALIQDLETDLALREVGDKRVFSSIFFGGGTPSLFAGKSIESILNAVAKRHTFSSDIEITLEANPGTIEHTPFSEYRSAGINRISLGAQSFQDDKLKVLGRVHQAKEIHKAIASIQKAKFNSFNIDIMYGLPDQTLDDARYDLETALQFSPPHLSWYNLTLEPNTVFHHQPPVLPHEDIIWDIQTMGFELLAAGGFSHYEVSAFAKPGFECQHNINYWQFGDYLGIGAGAHGKITRLTDGDQKMTESKLFIQRTAKTRFPKNYLEAKDNNSFNSSLRSLNTSDIIFEFMLNTLRLSAGFSLELFEQRTGLPFNVLEPMIKQARAKDLLYIKGDQFRATELGKCFLNDLISLFLPEK
jgi:putative oxygen-independent coproporphyrinogen III oxidase